MTVEIYKKTRLFIAGTRVRHTKQRPSKFLAKFQISFAQSEQKICPQGIKTFAPGFMDFATTTTGTFI